MTPPHPSAGDGDVSRLLGRARAAALAHHKLAKRMPPPLRIHGVLEGQGQVYHGAEFVSVVDYWLKDVEESDETVFPTGHRGQGEPTDPRTGKRGYFGFWRDVKKGNAIAAYVGASLTLQLRDGRALECTVTKVLTSDEALFQNYLVQGFAPRVELTDA